ncbi:MAG: hypothetical protein R3B96_01355 [Pirellulaceae bacterium]
MLDDTTFGGQDEYTRDTQGSVVGDDFISVDPTKSYRLSGVAMAGGDEGENFDPNNRQYFGVANYDIDHQFIAPVHVMKYGNAMDTMLAAPLKPGDTEIRLVDASGWANAGADHQRTLAWYGYTDSTGQTYDDYLHPQCLELRPVGRWSDPKATVIKLKEPWAGPENCRKARDSQCDQRWYLPILGFELWQGAE